VVVGCSLVFGLFLRCTRPLALMVCTDKVPFCLSGFDVLDIRRVVLIPSLTGSPSHRIVLATSGLVFAWLCGQTGAMTPAPADLR
jgi:hypothetical protein